LNNSIEKDISDKNKANRNIKLLVEIFSTFFKIGSFTLGGGYAMIPLIEREVVHNKGWIDINEIVDYFAVCQSIPGAIAINSAILIGYKTAGRKGAIIAAVGVILPSFLIITIIAAFFTRFQNSPIVKAAFSGIRSAVVALIAIAAFKIGKASIKDAIGFIVAAVVTITVTFLNIHAIFTIIGGALFGLLMYLLFPTQVKKTFNKSNNNTEKI